MMILRYPQLYDKVDWNKKKFPPIVMENWDNSGYFMVAKVETTFEVYVAFTNKEQDEIWIEKKHKLMNPGELYMQDLVKIEDDEEFNTIHRFLIKEGILDGTKSAG